MAPKIKIIGAGLAGTEAANFLANLGYKVDLYEKRPLVKSPAHHTDLFGELVCSNSLKSKKDHTKLQPVLRLGNQGGQHYQ